MTSFGAPLWRNVFLRHCLIPGSSQEQIRHLLTQQLQLVSTSDICLHGEKLVEMLTPSPADIAAIEHATRKQQLQTLARRAVWVDDIIWIWRHCQM